MSRVRVKKINAGKRLKMQCSPTELIRLLSKITTDPKTGCWLWTRHRDRNGYGQIKLNGRAQWAHRVSYAIFVRTIPDGQEIDHRCHNTSCINPNHLRKKHPLANASEGGKHGRREAIPF